MSFYWDLLALQDYDNTVGLDPSHAQAYYGRAMIYTILGDKSEAERNLELGIARASLVGIRFDEEVERLLALSSISAEGYPSGSDLSISRRYRFCTNAE